MAIQSVKTDVFMVVCDQCEDFSKPMLSTVEAAAESKLAGFVQQEGGGILCAQCASQAKIAELEAKTK